MKEAAEGLKLTSRTIAFHKYRIMEIHGLKTNAELIQLALSQRTLGARHHAPHPHPSTRGGRSDAPHPPHDARTTGLCSAQSDCRAGVRPDQAGLRLSAI